MSHCFQICRHAGILLFAILPLHAQSDCPTEALTIDFDTTAVPPRTCVDATAHLTQFGITFNPITPGASAIICNATPSGPGQSAAIPASPPNVFFVNPPVTNSPVSYTLEFCQPLTSVNFTRTAIVSGSTGPPWFAQALNAAGDVVDSASEGATLGPPPRRVTLTGEAITTLRVDANNSIARTFNHPPFDDLMLEPAERTTVTLELSSSNTLPSFTRNRAEITATATVRDADEQPIEFATVRFTSSPDDLGSTAGHEHQPIPPLSPTATFHSPFDPNTSTQFCSTQSDGSCSVNYVVPEIAGIFEIAAFLSDDAGITDFKMINVQIAGLRELEPDPAYSLTGSSGPTTAGACPGTLIQHSHNHFGNPNLRFKVKAVVRRYQAITGKSLGVNDMSLPRGGLFDICNNWITPHVLHRTGRSVDIDRRHASDGILLDDNNRRLLEQLFRWSGLARIREGGGLLHFELR